MAVPAHEDRGSAGIHSADRTRQLGHARTARASFEVAESICSPNISPRSGACGRDGAIDLVQSHTRRRSGRPAQLPSSCGDHLNHLDLEISVDDQLRQSRVLPLQLLQPAHLVRQHDTYHRNASHGKQRDTGCLCLGIVLQQGDHRSGPAGNCGKRLGTLVSKFGPSFTAPRQFNPTFGRL